VEAFLLAVAAATTLRLAFGTSIGRPGLEDVRAALAELGVNATELENAERQVAGVYHLRGIDGEGRRLLVKLYGRGAYDTQLLARTWRRLWYRGGGRAIGTGRLESAEHEAFVTLLARSAGLATRDVVTAAATLGDDALLVLAGDAEPLGSIAPEDLDDAVVAEAWRALGLLGELRIAHLQVDPETVALVSGEVGFVDFGEATVAPDADLLASDRAQLLITTAILVGSRRALETAVDQLGADGVEQLLPYLQSAAFSPSLRRAVKAAAVDVDEFRKDAAAAIGVEPPEPVKLRRVSWRALVQVVLLALASYAIASAATNVDWGELWSTVGDASWEWIAAAFVAAQLPRLTQAVSTLGSARPHRSRWAGVRHAAGYQLHECGAPVQPGPHGGEHPFLPAPGPLRRGGGHVGDDRLARGHDRPGHAPRRSADLLRDLPCSGAARSRPRDAHARPDRRGSRARLRRRARGGPTSPRLDRRKRPALVAEVKSAIANLRAAHKLALLVLGSVATEILFATALGLFARSLGYELSLAELLVINMSVSLLGSLVPVPGNIGVAEFGLTIGLVSAGMTDETALAAVLMYRIATFYLPPVWGFFAMLWLQRSRFL
jgi:glycosyltransferase 2 family protein